MQQLKDWKESAMSVWPDMQIIGKLLGVELGQSVHDKIIPGIERLLKEIHRVKEENMEIYKRLK